MMHWAAVWLVPLVAVGLSLHSILVVYKLGLDSTYSLPVPAHVPAPVPSPIRAPVLELAKVFFLPVTPEFVEHVIKREKPDGIVVSMGGQTALNCAVQLHETGILEKYNVQARKPWLTVEGVVKTCCVMPHD